MSPYERRLLKRFEQRLAEQSPVLEGDIFTAWRLLRAHYSEAELVRAIENGIIGALFTREVVAQSFEPFARSLQDQVAGAIDWAAKDLKLGVAERVFFDVANPFHIAAVDTIRTKVIDQATQDVREVLLNGVRDGILNGVNPRTTARALRPTIGLSDAQATAVRAFREELETGDRAALSRALSRGLITRADGTTTVRPGHAGGFGLSKTDLAELERDLGNKPIDPKKIDKWVEQYRKRQEAFHAETLARTATTDALKAGQHAATQTAIDKGFYDKDRMASRWVTTLDGRERPLHHEMNGVIVRFGQPFPTGEVIPGSSTYNCRCVKIDFQLTERQVLSGTFLTAPAARALALT